MLREIKESKLRIRKNKKDSSIDTLNITMELEKTLNINQTLELEREKMKRERKRFVLKLVLALVVVFSIISSVGYIIWLNRTYKVNEYANHAMISSYGVDIQKLEDSTLFFTNNSNKGDIGIIIIPAERVEQKSYARLSKSLAKKNHQVFVPKLTLNSAMFSKNKIEEIFKKHEDITKWIVIGHSDSGNMALKIAANEKKVIGAVFLGSYVIGDDLKLINKPSLLVWGTNDGILDFSKFNEFKKNLPEKTFFHEIVGGNNSNFADIQLLNKDNNANISNEEQQNQVVEQVQKFIENIYSQK